ncbi:MAG: hypothetical protein SFU91_05400 [Chloroherpetonaceae bacterium]|nr:hypothetical protein [Chloroherpetonaceae bacterium]
MLNQEKGRGLSTKQLNIIWLAIALSLIIEGCLGLQIRNADKANWIFDGDSEIKQKWINSKKIKGYYVPMKDEHLIGNQYVFFDDGYLFCYPLEEIEKWLSTITEIEKLELYNELKDSDYLNWGKYLIVGDDIRIQYFKDATISGGPVLFRNLKVADVRGTILNDSTLLIREFLRVEERGTSHYESTKYNPPLKYVLKKREIIIPSDNWIMEEFKEK